MRTGGLVLGRRPCGHQFEPFCQQVGMHSPGQLVVGRPAVGRGQAAAVGGCRVGGRRQRQRRRAVAAEGAAVAHPAALTACRPPAPQLGPGGPHHRQHGGIHCRPPRSGGQAGGPRLQTSSRGSDLRFQGPQTSPTLTPGVIRQRSRRAEAGPMPETSCWGGAIAGCCAPPLDPGCLFKAAPPACCLKHLPSIHLLACPQPLPPTPPRSVDSHALQHHGRCGGRPGLQQHCWRGPEGGAGVKAASRGHLISFSNVVVQLKLGPFGPPPAPCCRGRRG
jgi:hypothetical protein